MTDQPHIHPIQPHERIQILDILRGFAIFGILAVNMAGFASPAFLPGYIPADMPWYDHLAESVVKFFAEGKFYTIFSFLFGLGFSVQLSRADARGQDIRSFYPRRLWVLLGMGMLHAIFLWIGDILRLYALLGFVLLAFRKRTNRTLWIWAAIFFTISLFLVILTSDDSAIPGFNIIAMARTVYNGPSYLNVLVFQFFTSLVSFLAFILLAQGASVMALFMLGLLAGRAKIFERLAENRILFRRAMVIGLAVGLFGNSLYLFAESPWLAGLGFTLGAPALSAVYISGLSLLSLHAGGAKALAPLARVGRMALSNYVLQSVICAFLFGGFGFGLYEKVGPAGLLGITLASYLPQIPLSAWWLSHYRYGPLEWLWRSLTYGRREPMAQKTD